MIGGFQEWYNTYKGGKLKHDSKIGPIGRGKKESPTIDAYDLSWKEYTEFLKNK